MTINLVHKGIEVTPAIKAYVEEKMQSIEKFMGGADFMDVEVGMSTHHHHKGEVFLCKVNVTVNGGLVHIEREEEDLYKAIDKVRDHLREALSQAKKRQEDHEQGKI